MTQSENYQIHFRITTEFNNLLKMDASKKGLSRNEYIKHILLKRHEIEEILWSISNDTKNIKERLSKNYSDK